MFTGLVQHQGRIVAAAPSPTGRTIDVDLAGWSHRPDAGASIAVNGCCLTVAAPAAGERARFDVVPQTLRATTLGDLRPGDAVNLEHAVTPATLLGGHLVQGHVDDVGVVTAVEDGAERRLRLAVPARLRPAIVERGSIAVDGVSLTIAAVTDDGFEVALVPTTLENTTLGGVGVGRRCNVEVDCLVKAVVAVVERHLCARGLSRE